MRQDTSRPRPRPQAPKLTFGAVAIADITQATREGQPPLAFPAVVARGVCPPGAGAHWIPTILDAPSGIEVTKVLSASMGRPAGHPLTLQELQMLPVGSIVSRTGGLWFRQEWNRLRPHQRGHICASTRDWVRLDDTTRRRNYMGHPYGDPVLHTVDRDDMRGARLVWSAPEIAMDVLDALRPQVRAAADALTAAGRCVERDGRSYLTPECVAAEQVQSVICGIGEAAMSRAAEIRDTFRGDVPPAFAAADAWAAFLRSLVADGFLASYQIESEDLRHWERRSNCPLPSCTPGAATPDQA
jgi:hypothetical protein